MDLLEVDAHEGGQLDGLGAMAGLLLLHRRRGGLLLPGLLLLALPLLLRLAVAVAGCLRVCGL